MTSLYALFWQIARMRGEYSENKVFASLVLLMAQDKIDGFEMSPALEEKGIDAQARRGSKFYGISVKSSGGGVSREIERHPKRYLHEDKIFIVPERDESVDHLADRIFVEIQQFEERMHNK